MLSIDQRASVQCFACLKNLSVSLLTDRRGVETKHAGQRQLTVLELARPHAHPPVWRDHLVATARASLMIELREQNPVLHESPRGIRRRVHLHLFLLPASGI